MSSSKGLMKSPNAVIPYEHMPRVLGRLFNLSPSFRVANSQEAVLCTFLVRVEAINVAYSAAHPQPRIHNRSKIHCCASPTKRLCPNRTRLRDDLDIYIINSPAIHSDSLRLQLQTLLPVISLNCYVVALRGRGVNLTCQPLSRLALKLYSSSYENVVTQTSNIRNRK